MSLILTFLILFFFSDRKILPPLDLKGLVGLDQLTDDEKSVFFLFVFNFNG